MTFHPNRVTFSLAPRPPYNTVDSHCHDAQEICARVVAALHGARGMDALPERAVAARAPPNGAACATAGVTANTVPPSLADAIERTARAILRDDANLAIDFRLGTSDGGPVAEQAEAVPPYAPHAAGAVAAEIEEYVARMPLAVQSAGREHLEGVVLAALRAEAAQQERTRCEEAVEARFSRCHRR